MRPFLFKLALPAWIEAIVLLALAELGLPLIFVVAFAMFGGWVLPRDIEL